MAHVTHVFVEIEAVANDEQQWDREAAVLGPIVMLQVFALSLVEQHAGLDRCSAILVDHAEHFHHGSAGIIDVFDDQDVTILAVFLVHLEQHVARALSVAVRGRALEKVSNYDIL